MGGDFTPERFVRTPVSTIRWLLRQIDDDERGRMNLGSLSTAKMTAILIQVAHGFSGSKRSAPNVAPHDFLPFPDWMPTTANADGPYPPT